MSKIQATFERLDREQRKALIPFITAGDPEPALTVPLMHALVESGADIIELGVPFSDPMADGPTIQRASERALAKGVSLRRVLEMVANFRADGLIISSPTGSTAYALSAGGPILHPGVAGWLIVPIAPHMLSNRPIVVPDNGRISVEIVSAREPSVNFDMQSLASLLIGDRITVRRSDHRVRFLHPRGWNYFATLRKKLRWNEGGS